MSEQQNVLNLSKEDTSTPMLLDLTKVLEEASIPVPTKLLVGAGWTPAPTGEPNLDVDLTIAGINADGKLIDQGNFAFFNQKTIPGVQLGEDDRSGKSSDDNEDEAETDDETADIVLADLTGVGFIASLSVFDDIKKRTLKDAGDCYIRLVNPDTGEEMVRVGMSTVDADAVHAIKVTLIDGALVAEAIETTVTGKLADVIASLS